MDSISLNGSIKQGQEKTAALRMESVAERMARTAKHAPQSAKETKIREAAEEFEAVFISQMLEHMFAGVEPNETFGGGSAENIYKSMMIDEYGKIMAKTGGIGVADHVTRQLLQAQEQAVPNRLSISEGVK